MCIHETVRDKLLKNRSKRALLKKENKPKQVPYAHEPPIFQPRPAPCPFQPRPKVACFARSRFRRLFPSELRASPSDPSPCADAQSPRHTQRPQSSPKTRFSSRSTPDPAKNYNWLLPPLTSTRSCVEDALIGYTGTLGPHRSLAGREEAPLLRRAT